MKNSIMATIMGTTVTLIIGLTTNSVLAVDFRWSYTNVNPSGKLTRIFRVEGSYRDPVTNNEEKWDVYGSSLYPLYVAPNQRVSGIVKPSPITQKNPNNYHLYGDDPGRNFDISLAFVSSDGGNLNFLDLAEASALRGFSGDNEFFAPGLYSDTTDIYVSVDLTKWLNNPTVIANGEQINLINGVSEQLPGFLISTSPITFNELLGFTTNDPLNGTVTKTGILDGSSVPVPWETDALPVVGSTVLFGLGVWTKRKR